MPQDFRNDIASTCMNSTEMRTNEPQEEWDSEARIHFFAAKPLRLPKRAMPQGAPNASAVDATRQSHLFSNTQHPASFNHPILYTSNNMAEPKKQEKDFTKEVDALLLETKPLAKVRRMTDNVSLDCA